MTVPDMSEPTNVHLGRHPTMTEPTAGPPTLGPLLVARRTALGWSQLGLAERLCAAAGLPTITRHEVSRWERERRVPGDFWLGWLAAVLDIPAGELAAAAAASRATGHGPGLDRELADLRRAVRRFRQAALRWLADPRVAPAPTSAAPPAGPTAVGPPRAGAAYDSAADAGVARPPSADAGLAALRRLDDLVGGVDLFRLGQERLGPLIGPPSRRGPEPERPAGSGVTRPVEPTEAAAAPGPELRIAAEAVQLTGWLAADAGDPVAALEAYRRALGMATAARDRALAAYVISCASHLLAGLGDAESALGLARIGRAGLDPAAPAGLRALLLHRLAFAAALGNRRELAGAALAAAVRAGAERAPDREPGWLYWLDTAELAAMTGRCLAAAGRPRRAEPLLAAAVRHSTGPRGRAVYGVWWARAWLQLGDLERACAAADAALLATIRAGSARAVTELAQLRARLAVHRAEPRVRRHLDATRTVGAWLPRPARPAAAGPRPRGGRGTDSVMG
ncbi:transcriptional regulator [Plantactinospora siamensis]|uniref:Transcriptional regulator n=1 Tax=Plantactinospora siamensis TaxID=555372 RepID=A0ABV6NZN4_9ACTN